MKIKLLTYNIDGLNPIEIGYRTQVIIALIMSADPDIIQLQEVIPETYHLLRGALQAQGYASSAFVPFHYFTMTLVKTATFATFSFARVEFNSEATSQQGRSLLKTTVSTFDEDSLVFLNCHLESTGIAFQSPESFARQAQLRAGLDIIMQIHTSNTGIALLSGDLNIRDKEADAVLKQFSSIADLSPKPSSNTWFLPHNDKVQYRFDRIYGHNSLSTQVSEFRLMGCDPILDSSSGSPYLTPSDHRGISIAFTADRSTTSIPPDLQRKRERSSSLVNINDHEESNIVTAKKKTTNSISNDRTNNSNVELIDLT